MPPPASRGEVWVADLGMATKVRPCLILAVPSDPADRALVTVVPRTTSVLGTCFEVDAPAPFLRPGGVFDAQQDATVSKARLVRRLGILGPAEMSAVDDAVRRWLGL